MYLKSLQKAHNATQDSVFWSKRIFTSCLSKFNVTKWSYTKYFGTLEESLFVPEAKIKVHKSQSTMKEEKIEEKSKLNLKSLLKYKRKITVEIVPESNEKRPRAVVDLKLMQEELKQLQDPPVTPWEKQISSKRLPFSFYDVPSETLAKSLLGKVLVRKLENGTILKGRIVETESYLGVQDKASHTFGGKVTQRNIPMYMPPGTIYIYFTYGMYHCFNISSQEKEKFVTIKSVKPLIGLEYMELLRNTHKRHNIEGNHMNEVVKSFKENELCNDPLKICSAFAIEKDYFHGKKEGSAVLVRALEPIEGIEHMAENRSWRPGAKLQKKLLKELKVHELCNGPSKICMAMTLAKMHSKYSLCNWKELWIEDGSSQQEIRVVKCPRIGIESYGPEWANKPLRFYIYGHKCVSKRDKKAEAVFSTQ